MKYNPSTFLIFALSLLLIYPVLAQEESSETEEAPARTTEESATDDSSPLVVHKEPIQIVSQRSYQIPLYLEPNQKVQITAPVTSTILKVNVESGDMVKKGDELVQLENIVQRLELEKATAAREMAEVQLRMAEKSEDEDEIQLATARVAYSKAELELAKYELNRTSVKAPFDGRIFRVESSLGQEVERGWTMMTIGDVSKLTVEIPVDRKKVKTGDRIEIGIEDQNVQVSVHALLPLGERFAPIRELVESAASAIVNLDNLDGKYQPGQTVFVPIIPRHPVTEVANSSITNASGGKKKVQVLRENYVNDIEVQVFGPVGATRSYVSGTFLNGDLLVTGSSKPLSDGMHLTPTTHSAPGSTGRQGVDKNRTGPSTRF